MESSSVNLRVGVGKFFYGEDCLKELPAEILRLGGKPLVIGGPSCIDLISENQAELFANIDSSCVCKHTDGCSKEWARRYVNIAKSNNCTCILGIGGGKCLDLAKCVATFAEMDLICVPTSIATCVASSSVCIMYGADGTPDGAVNMLKEVDVVIADTNIIATAPKRTLAAGILDSIAKFPEVVHNSTIKSYKDTTLEKYICTINGKAIYEFLTGEAKNIYDSQEDKKLLTNFILTNLLHTSVVSGFSYGGNQLALAHGLYDFMRKIYPVESKVIMHGELVAVGVLMQMRYNENTAEELAEIRDLMKYMNMPVSLEAVNFTYSEANVKELKEYLAFKCNLNTQEELDKLSVAIDYIKQ